jgi:hypothetical protein
MYYSKSSKSAWRPTKHPGLNTVWRCRGSQGNCGLVCRAIYTGEFVPQPGIPASANPPAVCMHILRSTYLPDYASRIKPYYTSDPFPLSTPSPLDPTFTLHSLQRETAVLDQFILLKMKEDIKYDESELHLEGEGFKDILSCCRCVSRLDSCSG